MPNDNRVQRPSNDAPRDPLNDLIAPILGRDVTPKPWNVPTLPETSNKCRRNPLDDLVTDAELRAETSKAATRSVALNQGRRSPHDDLRRDAELSKQVFVDRDNIQKVIDSCPDAEWRALVALARYGGLRIPSEALSLRWEHINWDRGEMLVPSPKTELKWTPRVGQWETRIKRELAEVVSTVASDDRVLFGGSQ